MNRTRKISKKWIIIGSIVLLLVVARLMLPYFVVRYVNKVLADIPGYRGSITDVDIHLIRGAYSIDSLRIVKVDGKQEVPFVSIPVTDLSVEWKSIFNGAIVGEIIFEQPVLNFIGGDEDKKGDGKAGTTNQAGEGVDWTKPIKELMPLRINRLEIINGTIFFYDFTTDPKVDINLKNFNALATNLNNVEDETDRLPSSVTVSATSIGEGQLSVVMDMNVLKQMPDFDLNLKFENMKMPALNDFFMAYAKTDIEEGTFSVYSEITLDSGAISGYIKPIAQGIRVVDWKEDKKNVFNLIWQSIVGLLAEVFENQKKDQFATKVPIEGRVDQLNVETWPAVWNIFRNAFVKAFERNTENSVQFLNREISEKEAKRLKKEKRKESRKERRKQK